MTRENQRLLYITVIGFLLSLPSLFSPMVAQWDAYDRSMIAARLRQNNTLFDLDIIGVFWLPFHFIILSASLFVFNDVYFTPRLVTLFFSLGSVIAMYYYSQQIFPRKENVALLSVFIFALFPQRIILSTMTLSEPVFIFFFLLALIFAFNKKPCYFLSLFFLNIAHGIRYESWFFLPIYWWLIFDDKKIPAKKKILFMVFSLLIPLWWLVLNSLSSGNPLAFFDLYRKMAQEMSRPEFWNFNLALATWWEKLVEVVTFPGLLVTAYGIYRVFSEKHTLKQQLPIFIPFYFFLLLVCLMYFGVQEGYDHRYIFLSASLLMPFLAEGIMAIYSYLLIKLRIEYLPYLLLLQLYLVFELASMAINLNVYMTRSNSYMKSLRELISSYQRLNKEILASQPIYYYSEDNRRWAEKAFAYYSGKYEMISRPKKVLDNIYGEKQVLIVERDADDDWQRYIDDFEIKFMNDDYLILKPKSKNS